MDKKIENIIKMIALKDVQIEILKLQEKQMVINESAIMQIIHDLGEDYMKKSHE